METIISKKYKLTIAMPVFNGSRYVLQALESLVTQSFNDFQILIYDDASDDNTYEICVNFSELHDNIKVFRNRHNLGPHENFLQILKECDTELFLWASQDDIWAPNFLTELVSKLDGDNDLVLAMCDACLFSESAPKKVVSFSGNWDPEHLNTRKLVMSVLVPVQFFKMIKNNLYLHGVIRTSVLKSVIENLVYVRGHDRIWVAMLALRGKFGYVNEVMYFRRMDVGFELRTKSKRNLIYTFMKLPIILLLDLYQFNLDIEKSNFSILNKMYFHFIFIIYAFYRFLTILRLFFVSSALRLVLGDKIFFELRSKYRKLF